MKKYIFSFLFLQCLTCLTLFSLAFAESNLTPQTDKADKKKQVSASILPEKFVLKKLLKNHADIQVLINSGTDPHSFEPKPKQLMELNNSSIYFSIGLPFEKVWLKRFTELNPQLKEISLNQNIALLPLDEHEENHEHNHEHEHEGNIDPHIWTSPNNLKIMAQTATKSLKERYPDLSEELDQNLADFTTELNQLDQELKNIFAKLKPEQKTFIVFHPAFNYFAKDYNLKELVVEQEGREPNPKKLVELSKLAQKEKVKLMIVQKGFPMGTAKTIADHLNIKVIEIDPLSENIDQELIKLAKALVQSK
ncbi:metal ABC transporter solute-binding protein, Zn/Mn family [Desulfovibrio litoralis]|uniref:Zinc transport system substrate-binding protein n=1 Tax=Desulfovibrio litoralis DSM 11393 TaxID=1121455 RepID=A0A1M7RY70_9BACT|nr:zinc ABC transporter substrate-binding protein [Desulfovibrio litoralis]SHN51131.1 zinc transport system substrate-binding protein [Desulfovibrio litoralis DSM 11393]